MRALRGHSAEDLRVSTGLAALDQVLDGLRRGDNVVWRVEDIEDYRRFVAPFVTEAMARERELIYCRYGRHQPLLEAGPRVRVVGLDALGGFEAFTAEIYRLVTEHGPGAFYVFDCLSDLLSAWATDLMVGNLFRVVCPLLYELDTVAYFGLQAHRHSYGTMRRIRETTQVLIDVRRIGSDRYVQPVKACGRSAPTMFLPHRERGETLEPVVDSTDAARLQLALGRAGHTAAAAELDYWDRLFLEAAEVAAGEVADGRQARLVERLCRLCIAQDERMLALARRYLGLPDLLALRERMIGSGFIGGKAAGMLLSRQILRHEAPGLWQQYIAPHDSFFVGTDVYYSWLVHNGWWARVMRQRTPAGYFDEARALHADMLAGELPEEVRPALERMLDHFGQYPVLVRSSSLLEDGFGNAFAGKYESVFCVNQGDPVQRLEQLERAICRVWASTMSEDALVYRRQRGLEGREEPMALLLQRVNGRYHGRHYLPDAAGVAVSRNVFAWSADMDPAAGMVRMVVGLGTRAVDRTEGDHACVVALDVPQRRPWSQDDALRYSQHDVDVLDVEANGLKSLPVSTLLAHAPALPLAWFGEPDREATTRARRLGRGTVWRLSFSPLLERSPFVTLMRDLLGVLERAYDYPVDVEFTLQVTADGSLAFNPVQCRPLQTLGTGEPVALPREVADADLLFATQGHFMGGSIDRAITRVIRVDATRYAALSNDLKHAVGRLVGHCNRLEPAGSDSGTLLIGPGRWGSSTPALGVPVRFADINRVAALVEVAEMDARVVPDLSFGSHFFLDLVESNIAYVALLPQSPGCRYRPEFLDAFPIDHDSPHAAADDFDPAVVAAVRVHDLRGQGVRLQADVRSQRLLCHRTGGRTPAA